MTHPCATSNASAPLGKDKGDRIKFVVGSGGGEGKRKGVRGKGGRGEWGEGKGGRGKGGRERREGGSKEGEDRNTLKLMTDNRVGGAHI